MHTNQQPTMSSSQKVKISFAGVGGNDATSPQEEAHVRGKKPAAPERRNAHVVVQSVLMQHARDQKTLQSGVLVNHPRNWNLDFFIMAVAWWKVHQYMAATKVCDTFAFARIRCPTTIFMTTCSEHAIIMIVKFVLRPTHIHSRYKSLWHFCIHA